MFGAGGLVGEEFHRCDEGIRSSLAETADRGVSHGLGKLVQQIAVPFVFVEQGHRLVATHPTRRTLTAGLILEELQQIDRDAGDPIMLREDHDGVAADKRPVLVQSAEVEGHVAELRRKDAAGCAARKIGLELVSILHAAGTLN